MIIKKWIVFTEFGTSAVPWILNGDNITTTDEEISLCIQAQIYDFKEMSI